MRSILMIIVVFGMLFDSNAQKLDSATLDQLMLRNRETSKKEDKARLYKKLGDHCYEVNLYSEAKVYYDSSLALLSKKSNDRQEILKNYSFVLLRLGDYRESIKVLDELIPILVKKNDSTYLCKCYNRKGYNLIKLSKSDSSIVNYIKALQCFEQIGDQVSMINELNNLSNVLYRMEDDDKAMFYLQKAHGLASELQDTLSLVTISGNLAIQYTYLSKLDTAWLHANMSLRYASILGLEKMEVLAQLRMALISLKKGEYNIALSYVDSTLMSQQLDLGGNVTARKYKSEAYLKLRLYDSALNNITTAIDLARQGDDLEEIFILYQIASNIYEAMGNLTEALNHYKEYSTLKDSALNMQKLVKIETLMAKYDNEMKEEQINRLTQQNEIKELRNQHQYIIFTTLGIVLALLALSMFFFLKQRINNQTAQMAIRKEQLLRSQINPHFIFNALTSIRGFLFDKNDRENAINYLGKFAKLMRMVLDHSSKELVTLEEEINALRIYMEIQKMRFNNVFEYNISIDKSIQTDQVKVPPLLAQPFIENAIEHGFKNIAYHGKIDFVCKQDGELMRFFITDNGVGIGHIPHEQDHESKALSIFKQRIEILSSQFRTKLTFFMEDLGNTDRSSGTKIEYTLPILQG